MMGFFLLAWSLFLSGMHGEPHLGSTDKPWLAAHLIDSALLENATSVVRHESIRYVIESPQRYTHIGERTVTLLREASGENLVYVPYNKYCDAEITGAHIYDAFGRLIRKVKKSEFLDQLNTSAGTLYSDERVIFAKLSGGRYPFTLEYSYVIRYKETMAYPLWMPAKFHQAVEKASLSIEAPLHLPVHTEDRLGSFMVTEQTTASTHHRTWTLENWKPVKEEEHGPAFFEALPVLLISASSFRVESYMGSMDDWKQFGQFVFNINQNREQLSPVMAAQVQKMVRGIDDPVKRIDTLYKWMQQNTRYVSVQLGIGGWQSFDALYVEKNKFGDCKALSTFMKGMLKEIGIESWPVVIHWDDGPTLIAKDFASAYFNHMMLHIPAHNMWLECTSNFLPTGMIDKGTQGKPVLLITPEGGKLTESPRLDPTENVIHSTDTLVYDQAWSMSGSTAYSGNTQGRLRAIRHYSSATELREMFLEQFHLSVEKLNLVNVSPDKEGRQSTISYALQLDHFGSTAGHRYFLPVHAFSPVTFTCQPGQSRKTPFVSYDDHTRLHDVYIKMPDGYAVEYLPEPKSFEHPLARYSIQASMENGYIHVHRSLSLIPGHLPADHYTTLCKFYEEVRKADGTNIVFVSKA